MATQGLVSSVNTTVSPNPATYTPGGQPVDYTEQVKQLYRNNLSREGEQAGVDYWNKALQSGAKLDDVRQSFLDSSEYKTLNDKQKLLSEAKAGVATARGYNPTKWKVDAGQTVEGRIAGLTDPNSQLNQEAIARAQQAAQKVGLRNSSLAATAGQKAVLDTALPIASQDASTFANSGQFNAAADNAASQFGAAAENAASLQNAANTTAVSQSNAANSTQQSIGDKNNATQLGVAGLNAETQKFVATLNAKNQQEMANLDAKTKTDLQNIVSKNSQLLQSSTSASNAVAQYLSSVSQIQVSKDLDENAKRIAINNQLAALQESLRYFSDIGGSGLDLSKYFQQTGGFAPPESKPSENDYEKYL